MICKKTNLFLPESSMLWPLREPWWVYQKDFFFFFLNEGAILKNEHDTDCLIILIQHICKMREKEGIPAKCGFLKRGSQKYK